MKRKNSGFSLVEAAVVLVVIGIILGAVLQGRSLIESAEYSSFRQQLREYRAAFHDFRDRFDALPGDFNEASTRLGGGQNNGDGDGVIDDGPECDAASDATDECCLAWQHLRAAGMLGGNPVDSGGDASPTHPFGGAVSSFFTGSQGNGDFGHKILVINVPIDIAIRLDRDEDNELCGSGRISLDATGGESCSGDDWPSNPDDGTVNVIYAL